MFDMKNKTAIITGSSRGIGYGIAELLAKAGAHVILISRRQKDVDNVAANFISDGLKASAYACDVSDLENVQKVFKTVVSENGKIDILINNAGITRDTLIMRMSEDDWDAVININLKGAFNCIKAATRPMMKQRSGRIINISSVVGLTGNAGQINYAASKAGLIGVTKSTAKELAPRGITANCIAPGYIETEMTGELSDDVKAKLTQQIPLGRIGTAKDIASMALFLASDEANYITGQTFTVDGGMVMQ